MDDTHARAHPRFVPFGHARARVQIIDKLICLCYLLSETADGGMHTQYNAPSAAVTQKNPGAALSARRLYRALFDVFIFACHRLRCERVDFLSSRHHHCAVVIAPFTPVAEP
jgi:hypothetical protein